MANPLNLLTVTVGDICQNAFWESNVIGEGMAPSGNQISAAQSVLQLLLTEWYSKRWMIWHLLDLGVTTTGAKSYTVGPGGDFDTGANTGGFPNSQRPSQIEYAYLRQLEGGANGSVDFSLRQITSREDYSKIALKSLVSFPSYFFYDTAWPLGNFIPYPIPQASLYELHILIRDQFPIGPTTQATQMNLEFIYYSALLYNLAVRLRSRYGVGTFQGDALPGLARNALNAIKVKNTQIGQLSLPIGLTGRGDTYNIFSDQP